MCLDRRKRKEKSYRSMLSLLRGDQRGPGSVLCPLGWWLCGACFIIASKVHVNVFLHYFVCMLYFTIKKLS